MTPELLKLEITKVLATTKYCYPLKTKRVKGKNVVTDAIYLVDAEKAADKIINLLLN